MLKKITLLALSCLFIAVLAGASFAAPIEWSVADGGNGHYYDYITFDQTTDWHAANSYAQSLTYDGMSGYLTSITSQDEMDFISTNFWSYSYTAGYLSGNDYAQNGTWVWEGGPDDGLVFQIGWPPNATYPLDYVISTTEPNSDGDFLYLYIYERGGAYVNDSPALWGGAFVEYSTSEAAPVPEPSTLLLLGSGLAGLAYYGRKRKRA